MVINTIIDFLNVVRDALDITLIIIGLIGCAFAATVAFFYLWGSTSPYWNNLDEDD